MGRGKIEIKRIENTSNRQVTYSKRRNGLVKKAKEIAVLCDAKVSLIIVASSGKMHEYCSAPMVEILDGYHKRSSKKLWDLKHENLNNEIDRIKKENDSLQIKLRHLKGEDFQSLNLKELMDLEEALENGATAIRNKQSEVVERMRKNGKMLEEDNNYLKFVLRQHEIAKQQQQQQMVIENNAREIDNGYHHRENDYNSHMQFAFRVQPIQPNLHERI